METPETLPPPAVSALRAGQPMERSLSQDIRDEREELREAAEQTLNAIVDLNLDGTIKWVSPSWADVVGTDFGSISGVPISDLVVSENKSVFTDVIESMSKDDARSHRVRFAMQLGPLSKLRDPTPSEDEPEALESSPPLQTANLEAQGIMVYDGASGGESHTMWMLRPWMGPHEIQIDLPDVIVDSLGSGAEVLANFLTQVAESNTDDPEEHKPPAPILCRICERHIPSWWFEKHADLCLQEHRAEMDVQMAHENLSEHRHAIVKVLDALEARKSRSLSGEQQLVPMAEYKGMAIGPPPSSHSSPGTSLPRSQERPSGGRGHARGRSFAIRRPQARIVELLMDLCDTASEVSTPAIKESSTQQDGGDIRTQSPQSESRISQVLQWQSPSNNTLEQEHGLALLCADTEKVARTKVDAVFRHRKIIEYAERIRVELAVLVQDCIDEALRKAARIAAGHFSDSTESEESDEIEEDAQEETQELEPGETTENFEDTPVKTESGLRSRPDEGIAGRPLGSPSMGSPSALAAALRQVDLSSRGGSRSRPNSFVASTRSSSPKECPTPRSHFSGGPVGIAGQPGRRESTLIFESDTVASEGSRRSSSVASRSAATRTESPISDFGDLRRAASRKHQRRSLVLPGNSSPRRQESPSRTGPPSPLRIKARGLPYSQDAITSPEASPMLPGSEFGSPAVLPTRHHRRQSSAAISDFVMRPPPSPRLNANGAPPQARSTQPSIKDFEIIKPISKGAFGSVYLSKKKSTGEYFAIKVLKKADMVAKNQVGNVKAERAIMMWQGTSEFVAKLYWTFSSKDYLYLVMEYLNGGDCASLIKILGGLPEDWSKKYLGEVVLGVEHLHSRGIIHRDLKPDNLLIDQKGHLKLTDFGLSRMGLVGRQKRALNSDNVETTPDLLRQGPFARSASMASSRSTSLDLHGHNPSQSPKIIPQTALDVGATGPSYFSLGSIQTEPRRVSSSHRSDSGGSESLPHMFAAFSLDDAHSANPKSPTEEEAMQGSPDLSHSFHSRKSVDSHSRNAPPSNMMPPAMALFDPEDTNRRFVGTPDYLAPETINGDKQDETSDWWSVGCILFEFLYGIPPFHAGEAEKVFANILARKIQWPDPDECEPISDEAKDLINMLLCMDPPQRLGSNREEKFGSGGEQIRNHPWFQSLNWDTLLEDEAQFVPEPENPEDTEYFDARGAVLQSFAEEMEEQSSPQLSTGGSEYHDRPHDALSRVRSQVNSMNRKLMPLHIPPHVRDHKSRRLSEPVPADDFGSFAFKNLPVLEKANKDVIQKLRAEALAAQNKQLSPTAGLGQGPISPAPSTDPGSPVLTNPVPRSVSAAKGTHRQQSPSGLSHSNSSPSRVSQPSSPLLVSFVAGQGTEGRRKTTSNSSSLSHHSGPLSLQPGALDMPKGPPSLPKAATMGTPVSSAVSPVKGRPPALPPLALSPYKAVATPRQPSNSASRSRSLTVGSQDGSPVASDMVSRHRNRRSQVFDMSPSSSDNEGDKHNALLRVQRRRQSSRRLSQITFDGGPTFRPLDVLICEDHPVSRMVMEKLLEKLRCRTISVPNGSEAVRYSMSEIKFDVIFLEYRLPQINGADVARMIRETKNSNSHTPIVAITAYLKELQAPHYFDSLVEKPISSSKLTEVLRTLCHWRPDSPGQGGGVPLMPQLMPTLRKANVRSEESPTSSQSTFAGRQGSAMLSSREDSVSSSVFGDTESVTTADDIPLVISRKATGDWEEGGLGIAEADFLAAEASPRPLTTQQSAPAKIEHMARTPEKPRPRTEALERRSSESTESADDEDDEGGRDKPHRNKSTSGKQSLPSSKLGIEMMRANSHESMTTPEIVTQVATTPSEETKTPVLETATPAGERAESDDGTPRPAGPARGSSSDGTPTPRA